MAPKEDDLQLLPTQVLRDINNLSIGHNNSSNNSINNIIRSRQRERTETLQN